jgi:co-chaperonin GroES (HSP10)
MAQAIAMLHKVDPRLELQRSVDGLVNLITPLGAGVLVAIYIPPEKTIGGIILTDNTRGEGNYQGKVGLVLRLGPIAFQEDTTHRFGDAVPKAGDWVVFSVGETFSFELGKQRCRIVEDVSVRAIIDQPDIVY